jgi:Ca2+/Na+ antiporter
MAVGALTGAGVFVSGFVSAAVVLTSIKPVHLDYRTFVRDCVFYILALIILITGAFLKELNLLIGFSYIGIYVM